MNDDWRMLAACRGYDPTWWEIGQSADRTKLRQNERARRICRNCRVQLQCQKQADLLGAEGTIIAGKVWRYSGGRRRLWTSASSKRCALEGCAGTFDSSGSRRRYCSRQCQVKDRNREYACRRRELEHAASSSEGMVAS